MPEPIVEPTERERRLDEVLGAYLAALDTGQAPDRHELLERHADLAAELAEFFDDQERVDNWAGPLRPAAQAALATALMVETAPQGEGRETVGLPGPFGDYELLEVLGRGGMGVVYKARQQGLNRLVALEVVRATELESPAEGGRFRNEAE